MSAPTTAIRSGARAARGWQQRRANRRALARFGDFWAALQRVGDALADAEKAAKAADDNRTGWKGARRRQPGGTGRSPPRPRSATRSRSAARRCGSVSAQAKRFEPELIVKDWRR